jgi:glycosyltransferase involved in cell wall biosynthesis
MKVSVVVPAHNEEKYIADTLKALLAQDYPNFEVIVVNNASKDKTADVVRQFPGVILVDEQRKGLLFAREAGRQKASGDIIVNTDADCTPDFSWLRNGIAHFTKPEIVAVTGPVAFPDAGPVFRFFTLAFQRVFYAPVSWLLQSLHFGAVLIGGNNFIRTSALTKMGGYDTSILFYGEDTDTAKRLTTVGKVKFANNVLTNTSSRRFVKEGALHTSYLYMFNFLWVTFFKKTYSKVKISAKNLLVKKN